MYIIKNLRLMKNRNFKYILNGITNLNTLQERLLKETIKEKDKKKEVSLSLETDPDKIICPHCSSQKHVRWGKRNDMQRYKCRKCEKTFNSLTGTPLAKLKKKGHWLDYSYCLTQGYTIRKAAKICSISIETSFRWRHRFLDNSKKLLPNKISGIVEADETYFVKSEKGSKKLKRKARKRGYKTIPKDKKKCVCVLISRDRNNNTYDKIFDKLNTKNIHNTLHNTLSNDALFCTAKKNVYLEFTKKSRFKHGYVDLNKGEIIKKDIVHIQNIRLYHRKLNKWISRFNGVATKYLENYLSWFRELDEYNMKVPVYIVLQRAKIVDKYSYQPVIRT